MKIIGLTGGIGSGKTSVASKLRALGARVFDADEVAKNAVLPGTEGFRKVVEIFGTQIVDAEGKLDRTVLAEIVFNDKESLKTLEEIIHGYVWQETDKFLIECRQAGERAVILDVPLLIECGWHKKVDEVWLVALPVEKQIMRTMERSGMTAEAVQARIAAQMSLDEKKKYATLIIDNSGTWEETEKQVIAAWEKVVK
ncbi:MAG: dephospho-CoA kinase [Acholeplasmataceae bacterium]|nr:dephospho-CoA kinase [Acholeplasmataceae bacterium]